MQKSNMNLADEVDPAKFYPSRLSCASRFRERTGKLSGRRNMDASDIYRYCQLFTSLAIYISCELHGYTSSSIFRVVPRGIVTDFFAKAISA